jgi:hypothetical protein
LKFGFWYLNEIKHCLRYIPCNILCKSIQCYSSHFSSWLRIYYYQICTINILTNLNDVRIFIKFILRESYFHLTIKDRRAMRILNLILRLGLTKWRKYSQRPNSIVKFTLFVYCYLTSMPIYWLYNKMASSHYPLWGVYPF